MKEKTLSMITKKTLTIVMVFMMVFTLVPMLPIGDMVEEAAAKISYAIGIDEHNTLITNGNYIIKQDNIYYDKSNKVLSLSGVEISGSDYGIWIATDANITIIGSAKITAVNYGIYSKKGSVSLKNIDIEISDKMDGIWASGSITFDNAGHNVTVSDIGSENPPNCGYNCCLHSDQGNVVITGGNYCLTSENADGIYAGKNISIANVNKMTVSAGKHGIESKNGTVTLSNCYSVTITASSGSNYTCGMRILEGDTSIIGVDSLTVNGNIVACGDFLVDDSTAVVKGGIYDDEGTYGLAIYVMEGTLHLNRSTIECGNGIDVFNMGNGPSIVATDSSIKVRTNDRIPTIWKLQGVSNSDVEESNLCIGFSNYNTHGTIVCDEKTVIRCNDKDYKLIENAYAYLPENRAYLAPYTFLASDDSDSPSQTSAQISFADKYVEAVDGTMMPESEVYKYNDSLHAKEVADIQNDVKDWRVICKTKLGKKGIKAYAYLDGNDSEELQALINKGYRIEYNWYRSTKSSKGYKFMYSTDDSSYYNTSVKKGTRYFYKCVITIYDQDGQIVRTILADCKAGYRLFKKN